MAVWKESIATVTIASANMDMERRVMGIRDVLSTIENRHCLPVIVQRNKLQSSPQLISSGYQNAVQ